MTTFHSLFGETHYDLDVPEFSALVPAAVIVALVGCTTLVKTRSVARALSVAAALVASLFVIGATRGTFFRTGWNGSPLSMFPSVFAALTALATASAVTVVFSLGAAIDRVVRRARAVEYLPALAALGLSIGAGVVALQLRLELGSPIAALPQLIGEFEGRVQVGASTRMSAFLGHPGGRVWLFRVSPTRLDADQRARLRADCVECEREITGVNIGRYLVTFRGRVGPYSLRRTGAYNVEDNRGSPRWPLRVGERWTYRERLESTTRAGGWASAIASGPSHLAPSARASDHMTDKRRELRVERSFVENGIRFWELHYESDADDRTMVVYGHNGVTWLVDDRRDPWRSRQPLIEGAPERGERFQGGTGLGVFSCRIRGLDFTHCGDGTNPRIPFGPVRGGARDSSGQGLFIAAVTLGALVPGAGARWAYCLEQHTEGTGVEMPVWRHSSQPLASNDPRGERFALCAPRE